MKLSWIMPMLIVSMLCGSVIAAEPFKMPSDEVIKEIAKNPEKLRELISKTTEDETAQIMILVIGNMESSNMPEAQIQANVLLMLNTISEERGGVFSMTVLAMLNKKVNPRLLPVIPVGSGPGTPPGGGGTPKYRRQ